MKGTTAPCSGHELGYLFSKQNANEKLLTSHQNHIIPSWKKLKYISAINPIAVSEAQLHKGKLKKIAIPKRRKWIRWPSTKPSRTPSSTRPKRSSRSPQTSLRSIAGANWIVSRPRRKPWIGNSPTATAEHWMVWSRVHSARSRPTPSRTLAKEWTDERGVPAKAWRVQVVFPDTQWVSAPGAHGISTAAARWLENFMLIVEPWRLLATRWDRRPAGLRAEARTAVWSWETWLVKLV